MALALAVAHFSRLECGKKGILGTFELEKVNGLGQSQKRGQKDGPGIVFNMAKFQPRKCV
jgi:hypothetical protein